MSEKKNAYENNSGFSFVGVPEDIDIEQEVTDAASSMEFDAYRLAEVLMIIGQKMTGIKLYSYQYPPAFRIIYSMLSNDGAQITMLFSRQSGKSEVITFTAITMGVLFPVLAKIFPKQMSHFEHGVKMGLLAPQSEQVDTVYSRCMERLLSEPVREFLDDPDILDSPMSSVHFKLKSGSFLTGQSAAKQSKIESKTYHIVFLDEAQDMDTDKVRKSIMPMLASTFGTCVRTGTPSRQKGDFYYTIKDNEKSDRALKFPKDKAKKQLHFQYNYEDVIKAKKEMFKVDNRDFHLLYEKSVNRDRKSWGENSDIFRLAYKVEWILEVGMFITEKTLTELCYDHRLTKQPIDKRTDFIVAGLDIASARNDTVLTIARVDSPAGEFGERPRKTVLDWLVLSNTNYEEQFHAVSEFLIRNHVKVLYSDNTGVGRALTDLLAYYLQGYMEIVPYMFTPASKSDMWKALDEDIGNRRVIVPAHRNVKETQHFKMFEEQMTNLQKFWRGAYMVCDKTSGHNDDFCDSLGLMNLAGNHLYSPPTEMEVTDNNLINTHERNSMMRSSRY